LRLDAIGLWLGLAIFVAVVGLGVVSRLTLVNRKQWVEHTHQVIESVDALTLGLSEAMSARRGFSLTGDSEERDRYARARTVCGDAERRIRVLTVDNLGQQRRLDELEPLVARHLAGLDAAIASRQLGDLDPAREVDELRSASMADAQLGALLAAVSAEEHLLLIERYGSTSAGVKQVEVLEAAGAAVSFGLIGVVVVRLRREVRRRTQSERVIRDSEQAIKRLNEDLEARVDERTAELKILNRELESFSYSVVHDLRAPLRGMCGFAEVLLDEYEDSLSADAQDALREIQQNARKMAILIDALVSMSRVTRSVLNRSFVDLNGVARAIAARLVATQPSLPVTLTVQEPLEAVVDADMVRALIAILLENAWKFSAKAAAPRVEIGATETDGERVFFVRDTGAGFDMAHAVKLFSPFGRLHTVDEFPGIGIGLATAQRIVQRHGGRIWGNGEVGRGASFYFTLAGAPGEKRGRSKADADT
jgi:signal transduction histidine kinase